MAKAKKHAKDYEHEMQLALIKAFAADPELKYYVGMAAGSGVAVLAGVLATAGYIEPENTDTETNEVWIREKKMYWGWTLGPMGPIPWPKWREELTRAEEKDVAAQATTGAAGIVPMSELMAIGATGFAGTCAMILILKAIFGTGGMAEVLKGVGEIVPL